MVFSFRWCIIFLYIGSLPFYLCAQCWPLAIFFSHSHHQSNHFFSASKHLKKITSRKSWKKKWLKDAASSLFSLEMKTYSNCTNVQNNSSLFVSVLLAQADKNAFKQWHFSSEKGFIIVSSDSNHKKKKITTCVKVTIQNGTLLCNGKHIKGALHFYPLIKYGECNGIMYDGSFSIVPYKDCFLCINKVELEDYITAVLKTESWPGWPLEVNKVFAITSRSYVLFKMLEAQKIGRPYHVKNTNAHQTYKGKHTIQVFKKAVEQTKGIVIGFKGKPILAMFDSCCGGIIPAHIEEFDFSLARYLARPYACTFCKHFPIFSWRVEYSLEEFESLLNLKGYGIKNLSTICINKKDAAGLVGEIMIRDKTSQISISGKQLYSLLSAVKSFYFDIQKKSDTIIFIGHGFGHHLGLCQWGAYNMVNQGWDFKSIIRFHFPGTHFMQLIQ